MWEKWALFFHAPGVLKNFHVFQLNFRFITTLSQNSKETLTLGSLVIIEHGSFNAHAKQAHFFQKKKIFFFFVYKSLYFELVVELVAKKSDECLAYSWDCACFGRMEWTRVRLHNVQHWESLASKSSTWISAFAASNWIKMLIAYYKIWKCTCLSY